MLPPGTLLLTRREITDLLPMEECIDAVETAFALAAHGRALPSGVLGVPARDGGFHIKAAGLELGRLYFAAKVNGNFAGNPELRGLPTIQGVIVLCDGESGAPLALMDSTEITALRTAAATAVAAKYLARPGPAVITICGCGHQARYQLRALATVRQVQRVFALDLDQARAARFADELVAELGIAADTMHDLPTALHHSDIAVTCTSTQHPFVHRDDLAPGIFLAAVGADSHDKQELEPDVFVGSTVVVDVLEQCATMGDLHHALASGLVTLADVHAELAEVVVGAKARRTRTDEIIVFDSTGTALQDVAAAARVYEKAVEAGIGLAVSLRS